MLKEAREVWTQANIPLRSVHRIIFIKKMFSDKYAKLYP